MEQELSKLEQELKKVTEDLKEVVAKLEKKKRDRENGTCPPCSKKQ